MVKGTSNQTLTYFNRYHKTAVQPSSPHRHCLKDSRITAQTTYYRQKFDAESGLLVLMNRHEACRSLRTSIVHNTREGGNRNIV